jgi:hypothetical protein
MASRSFTVHTDAVDQLATSVDDLARRFESVAQRRVGYQGHADAPAMEDGLRDFYGHWTDGMEKLHGQLTSLATHLHHAASTYDETDDSIRHAAGGGGGGGGW